MWPASGGNNYPGQPSRGSYPTGNPVAAASATSGSASASANQVSQFQPYNNTAQATQAPFFNNQQQWNNSQQSWNAWQQQQQQQVNPQQQQQASATKPCDTYQRTYDYVQQCQNWTAQ